MNKILINLNGKQLLVEVGQGGGVTSDAQILWNEQLHGSLPQGIEIGKMEAYDEDEPVVDHVSGEILYQPEVDEDGNIVLDEEGNTVFTENPQLRSVRKLRKLENVMSSHANAVASEEQARINNQARAYLASTDWLVVRMAETGVAVPQEILDARAAARASIVE